MTGENSETLTFKSNLNRERSRGDIMRLWLHLWKSPVSHDSLHLSPAPSALPLLTQPTRITHFSSHDSPICAVSDETARQKRITKERWALTHFIRLPNVKN